ncbi:hypothetical protein [Streptomyces alboniger]|uniref:hypothetical protein n=1 Tax=Streptomyces alboniger TaxID=132473 RepID=UPI0006E25DA2|nr:hypothetical protein [Streptomyces alboniger]
MRLVGVADAVQAGDPPVADLEGEQPLRLTVREEQRRRFEPDSAARSSAATTSPGSPSAWPVEHIICDGMPAARVVRIGSRVFIETRRTPGP